MKKLSPRTGTAAALVWARAQDLIRRGRLAEARRLLQALARVKGPYQARAKLMLARLARGAIRPPRKMNGHAVKKARAPHRDPRSGVSILHWTGGGPDLPTARRPPVRRAPKRTAKPKRTARAKPPAKPATIKRIPHMDLPEGIRKPGDSFTVEVYVNTKKGRPGETSAALVIERKARQVIYDVEVWMAGSSHFLIDPPKAQVLKLDVREDESKKATFNVRVAQQIDDPAGAILFAYFSYHCRPSGQVSRLVKVSASQPGAPAAGAPPPRPPAGRLVLTRSAPSADLTIEVTDPRKTSKNMVCNVSSTLVGPEKLAGPQDWDLPQKSDALVKGYMKEFVDKKNVPAYSLIGAGTRLFKAAPKEFKTLLWDLIDAGTPPKTILISSEEPNIPWELMVPCRPGKDGTEETRQALGVEFKVGRWISGDHRSPPTSVPLTNSFVIAPTYVTEPSPLKKSAEEVALVSKAVPGPEVKPADLENIKKQLGAGGRSLLHFVCHGADGEEGSDVQAIFLDRGKERLTSLAVTAIPEVKLAFKKRPMVFLNACEVGRPTVALTGIGGFAAAFLDLGAAAVIAPLWSVKDTIAFEVARRFYEAAVTPPAGVARKGFADIMREIRALAYDEKTGEDTYAAYCFYGDPNASAPS